jgi:flavodoxin
MRALTEKIVMFLFCLLIPGLVWSQTITQKDAKVLVVYYSREGHTKLVAEQMAKKFNADLEQLIDKKKRTGLIGVSSAGKDAVAGNLTSLEPLKRNPQDYDIILIGTPSWFGNLTPAVRTFIKENDLSGKKVGLFGTAHLTGVENALKQAAELISKENAGRIPTLPLRHRDLPLDILSGKIDAFYEQFSAQEL